MAQIINMNPNRFFRHLLFHTAFAGLFGWLSLTLAEWLIPGFALPFVNLVDLSLPAMTMVVLVIAFPPLASDKEKW